MASRKKEYKNILDYIYDYGISSFVEVPFFDLDAAIFAQLSYLELEKTTPVNNNFKIGTIQKIFCEYFSSVRVDNADNSLRGDDLLALTIMSSPRYKNIKITKICSEFSIEEKTQFYAMEFLLPTGDRVISFRGTDLSITGWEENADLVCFTANRGQKLAEQFLEKSASKNKKSNLYVVGHSKGGNLAVFSSSLVKEEYQKRIVNVYSFDGPGLMDEMYDFIGHKRIQDKIIFIVPEDEIVGMLLKHEEITYIVETATKNDFVASHYIMNWKVENDHFIKKEKMSLLSENLNDSTEKLFNDYLSDINLRVEFFSFFFQTIKKLGIKDPQVIFNSPVNFFFSFSNEVRKSPHKKLYTGFLKAFIAYFSSSLMKGNKSKKKDTIKKKK